MKNHPDNDRSNEMDANEYLRINATDEQRFRVEGLINEWRERYPDNQIDVKVELGKAFDRKEIVLFVNISADTKPYSSFFAGSMHADGRWCGDDEPVDPSDLADDEPVDPRELYQDLLEAGTAPFAYVDAEDIDYPGEADRRVPVLVQGVEQDDAEAIEVATVIDAEGEVFMVPAGLLIAPSRVIA